jgi:hypothetical protein
MPRPIKVTYKDSNQGPFRLPMARYLALQDSDLKLLVQQQPPVWQKPVNLLLLRRLETLLLLKSFPAQKSSAHGGEKNSA